MQRAKFQHWKNPKSGKWDAQSHKAGRVGFITRQGYERESSVLDAIEAVSGSRESTRVEFKDRVKSPSRNTKKDSRS